MNLEETIENHKAAALKLEAIANEIKEGKSPQLLCEQYVKIFEALVASGGVCGELLPYLKC